MKNRLNTAFGLVAWLGLVVIVSLGTGCKKEEAPPPAAAVPVEAPQAAPAPAQAQVPDALVPADEAEPELVQLDARLQNQDYEGAVDVILRAQLAAQQQQAMLSDQQRLNYHNRMRMLQKQIADAMASGDPNAQRAAQLLMQYNAARTQAR